MLPLVKDGVNTPSAKSACGALATPPFNYIGRYPDDKVSIIILSNTEGASIRRASRGLAAIVFGQKYEVPRKPVKLNPQIYNPYLGKYQFPDGNTFDIEKDGDKPLLVAAPKVSLSCFHNRKLSLRYLRERWTVNLSSSKEAKGQVTHLLADWDTQVKKPK